MKDLMSGTVFLLRTLVFANFFAFLLDLAIVPEALLLIVCLVLSDGINFVLSNVTSNPFLFLKGTIVISINPF